MDVKLNKVVIDIEPREFVKSCTESHEIADIICEIAEYILQKDEGDLQIHFGGNLSAC